MNVLITGACGVTSRAVARSLHMSSQFADIRLVGTDICENRYGVREGLFEKIYRVPLWNSPDYMTIIGEICTRAEIDMAIVIPEPEVLMWSESVDIVPALLPPPKLGRIALSKSDLFDVLAGTGLVPSYRIYTRDDILEGKADEFEIRPYWLRDCSPGATSGKGAIKVVESAEARAWAFLQKEVTMFMASEYLPGRNLACCMLFYDDELLKCACAERIKYFAGHLVLSGITGNAREGRLINDDRVRATAEECVRLISKKTNEILRGLLTVDLKENCDGVPLVTEINLRHVAFTSAFSAGGVNMAEAQLLATMGLSDKIDTKDVTFPSGNLFLRDIDGLPLWIQNWKEPQLGWTF
jgi:carbamoyl-phosphate synthase large subunit